MNGLISMSSQDGIAALPLLLLLGRQLGSMGSRVLSLLVVLVEFLLGLERGDGSELNIEGSDGLVVFLRNVGVQVGEGMHGAVGWHDHIGPSQQVGENVGLVDLLKDLVVMLDLIHVLELQLGLALPLLCLFPSLFLFLPCQIGLFPGSILGLFLRVHHYLTVHDFTLAVHLLVGRKRVVGQFVCITGKFLLEVEVEFGERGPRGASSLHEDLLCGLKRIFGPCLGMQGQKVIGVLFERDYLVDCIG